MASYSYSMNDNNNNSIGKCRINVTNGNWEISSWYVNKEYQHKGYGRKMLKACMVDIVNKEGLPRRIDYIWNGENSYVYEWLNDNFSPICACPIAVQKNASDDDWNSHIYHLDTEKFLKYFKL